MKRNIKSLLLKARYLKEEHKEAVGIYEEYHEKFFKDLDIFIKNNNISYVSISSEKSTGKSLAVRSKNEDLDSEQDKVSDNSLSSEIKVSDSLKKVYRKIAMITHPDRYPTHMSEVKKKEMINIYNKSTEAIRVGDVFCILDAASELYIDLPELNEAEVKSIEGKGLEFEELTGNMKNTYVWAWKDAAIGDKEYWLNKFLCDNYK